MSARRFLWRWNGRVLRREWRQYAVIFALIATAATLSTAAVLFVFNITTPPGGEGYGRGNIIAVPSGEPALFEQALIDQGHPYGAIESAQVIATGTTDPVTVEVIDPDNEVTEPLLSLLDGRWPTGRDEVAVTDRVLIDGAAIGDSFELNGVSLQVVGLVEDPTNLNTEFVLASGLDPLDIPIAERSTRFLIDADPTDLVLPPGIDGLSSNEREQFLTERTASAIAVNVVSGLAMLEVALLASAGFAVIARRRSRQYGLLAAAGATPRQIRAAATVSGTILGLVAGSVGVVLGGLLASIIVPPLERTVAHRIDFTVPWWAVTPTVVFSILIPSIAARWPARALSKQPVVHLLASMRSRPEPVGWSTALGLVLAAAGGVALAIGFTRINLWLALAGVVLGPIGLLLLSPLLVGQIGRLATRLPLPARMGGRQVARYNKRSASVVAALALALAVPTAIAVTTTSLDQHNATKPPNMETTMGALWLPGSEQEGQPFIPADTVDRPPDVETAVSDALALIPGVRSAPIEIAVAPFAEPQREEFDRYGPTPAYKTAEGLRPITEATCGSVCNTVGWGEVDEDGNEIIYKSHLAWLATPAMLELLGLDELELDSVTAITNHEEMFFYGGYEVETGIDHAFRDNIVVEPSIPATSSTAPMLVTEDFVQAQGYRTAVVGWLLVAPEPIPAGLQTEIDELAGSVLVSEFHEAPARTTRIRTIAILLGFIAGLGIAVAAVSLLATESVQDLRVLRSIGAEPATARRMSAAMAALLSGAGALLAVFIGYLALIPQLSNQATDFPFVVPWPALGTFLVLFPAVAAAVGWSAGGRRHQSLARSL